MLAILKKTSFFIIIAIAVVLFLYFTKEDDPNHSSTDLNAVLSTPVEAESEAQPTDNTIAVVDVKGQVKQPGVYEMDVDSRVNDVIDTAGGFTKDADQTQVNLAQRVQDEMIIMIPKEGEVAEQASGETADGSGKVKINYATQEEIESLNGIGPSKAQSIIQHREEHGLFKTVEDLLEISGIGEKTLENIKDYIQVP
ncbi:competence protein ComEA [Virgibacillus halotolerans]|uniref:helix-hairpin-helix domain-containing protein n=1 Tax=Virgibacillus halotolerans TaxID=1071053 RepID=UPI0019602742|nr:helix-hairpin-helix domain-containing protein [Virgibacillus halotolerans]MBM7597903.1 competence protein ComEA [Virgibacillus halotolerans]